MYRVAIVEDEREAAENLRYYIERYGSERGCQFIIQIFGNGVDFISDYTANYDMVFMDIELPIMNGMDCARKLREQDRRVALVFVTNMVQYSVKGYEVDAVGYIVKPVEYFSFTVLMDKIIDRFRLEDDKFIVLKNADTFVRISLKNLVYVEVLDHYLMYHTGVGDTYKLLGKIRDAEAQLSASGFFRCSNSYLVNLRYVTGLDGSDVIVGDEKLPVSRNRKKDFLTALNEYFRKGGIC